jgi:hypothetical protein
MEEVRRTSTLPPLPLISVQGHASSPPRYPLSPRGAHPHRHRHVTTTPRHCDARSSPPTPAHPPLSPHHTTPPPPRQPIPLSLSLSPAAKRGEATSTPLPQQLHLLTRRWHHPFGVEEGRTGRIFPPDALWQPTNGKQTTFGGHMPGESQRDKRFVIAKTHSEGGEDTTHTHTCSFSIFQTRAAVEKKLCCRGGVFLPDARPPPGSTTKLDQEKKKTQRKDCAHAAGVVGDNMRLGLLLLLLLLPFPLPVPFAFHTAAHGCIPSPHVYRCGSSAGTAFGTSNPHNKIGGPMQPRRGRT